MAKRTIGVASGQPVRKGSWGDRYVIEKNYQNTRVSCYTCKNCVNGYVCEKQGINIPAIGATTWKTCKYFMLPLKYQNEEFKDKVLSLRGSEYIEKQHKNNKKKSKSKNHKSKEVEAVNIVNDSNFDVSCFNIVDEVISNICFTCYLKKVNPKNLIRKIEDQMHDHLDNIKMNANDSRLSLGIVMGFLQMIANELDINIINLFQMNKTEKEKIINEILSREDINSEKRYYERDLEYPILYHDIDVQQFYFVNPEYTVAYDEALNGIYRHKNEVTGAIIDLDQASEYLPFFIKYQYNEDETILTTRIYFNYTGTLAYNSWFSGIYEIYFEEEIC